VLIDHPASRAGSPKGRRINRTLYDTDNPLRSENRVGMGQVEADKIEASVDEGLTISTRSSTESTIDRQLQVVVGR